MKIRAKKISEEMRLTRKVMILFFAVIIVFAALVPHMFKGNAIGWFEIAEDYEQSAVILMESFFVIIFYRIYRKKMNELSSERSEIEKHLKNSYAHIGRVNNELELVKNFITTYPGNGVGKLEEKNSYEKLLVYMLVSVAKTSEGFVRFIDIKTGKTLKEFVYANDKNQTSNIKLSNSLVMKKNLNYAYTENGDDVEVVESYYHESPIKCVLCFPKKEKSFDRSLIQLLLTHIHLLFMASRPYARA